MSKQEPSQVSLVEVIPRAKSSRTPSTGLHGWLPYYAGFSPDFVSVILGRLSLGRSSLVFDPFAGSGTTNIVSKTLGIPSIGLELNPVAYLVANAKLCWGLQAQQIEKEIGRFDPDNFKESTSETLPASDKLLLTETTSYLLDIGREIVRLGEETRFFLLSVAVETLRRLSNVDKSSNPTWSTLKPRSVRAPGTFKLFAKIAQQRLSELESYRANRGCPSSILFDDASTYKPDFKANAIVTSPPYLNRLDYIMNFALENSYLLQLGFPTSGSIGTLRDQMMGTVTVGRSPKPDTNWGPTCLHILEAVRTHPSRAAESYYLKTMTQYFERLQNCIRMFFNVLANNGVCCMVVRSSYFKDLEIPLASIVKEMAVKVGFNNVSYVREDAVNSHLGRMDPDQRKWVPNKSLVENVIFMGR
jgi:DNA modification methylase